jgi:hypothetical protein
VIPIIPLCTKGLLAAARMPFGSALNLCWCCRSERKGHNGMLYEREEFKNISTPMTANTAAALLLALGVYFMPADRFIAK